MVLFKGERGESGKASAEAGGQEEGAIGWKQIALGCEAKNKTDQ